MNKLMSRGAGSAFGGKTVLNIKIDPSTKQEAAKLADKMGLSLSAVVVGFLRNYIQTQELHITAAPRMTPYLEKVVGQAREDWNMKKNISGPLKTPAEIAKHLNKLAKK
jgi:addiction module RelB/DinJ family antitoxin